MGRSRYRKKSIALLPGAVSRRFAFTIQACVVCALLVRAWAQTSPPPLKFVKDIIMPNVPLGPYSDHLAVDLQGHRLFATPQAHKSVQVLSLDTGRLIHEIPGMGNPHSILYRADRDEIFVADGGFGLVKIYSGRDYHLLKQIKLLLDADSIAYDPATQYLYVTNGGEGAKLDYALVSIIDTTRGEHIGDVRIPADTVEAMTLDAGSSRLYINVTSKNSIGVIDRKTRALAAMWPITMGKKNMASALDSANHRLFVGCRNTETTGVVVIFDTERGKELQTLPISGWVDYMAFDQRAKRLYASCGSGAGSAYVFQQDDADHYRLLGIAPTAPMAKTALLVPELRQFLVSVPHKDPSETARVMVFAVQ